MAGRPIRRARLAEQARQHKAATEMALRGDQGRLARLAWGTLLALVLLVHLMAMGTLYVTRWSLDRLGPRANLDL